MSSNPSFSSSLSTLSYHSSSSELTTSDSPWHNSQSSSSSSTGAFPMYRGDTLSPIDYSLGDESESLEDNLLNSHSGLYDLSVKISIDLPKDETYNRPDMLRATIYTICGEIFFKHKEWRSVGTAVAYKLGRAINPTSSTWFSSVNRRYMYRGQTRISGHTKALADGDDPSVVCDTIGFSDFICATNVKLEYSVDVFLSPAVGAAEKFYLSHGFSTDVDNGCYKGKHMEDVMTSHKEEGLQDYDQHLAWATVYNVLEEYRQSIQRQNKFYEDYGLAF